MELTRKRRLSVMNGDPLVQQDPGTCGRIDRPVNRDAVDQFEHRTIKRHCLADHKGERPACRIMELPAQDHISITEPRDVPHGVIEEIRQIPHDREGSFDYTLDSDELTLLSKDQLLDILIQLVNQHQYLAPELARMIPGLSPSSAEKQLLALEKELQDALPRTKDGVDSSSDYAFTRANVQLRALKNKLIKHLYYFANPFRCKIAHSRPSYPLHSFQFLGIAGSIVQRFPVWQNDLNNREFTVDSYAHMASAWKITISEIAKSRECMGIYPISLVSDWFRTLHFYTDLVKGNYGFLEALKDFISTFSWCPLTLENSSIRNPILPCQHISIDRDSSPHGSSSSRSASMLTSVSS